MNKVRSIVALTFVTFACSISIVAADSWALPKKEKYYSPNKNYYLKVTPKKLESQLKYFEDKVEGKSDPGALRTRQINRARGEFYVRRSGSDYARRWRFPLVNEVSPVSAIVSDRGAYVVTFDNWHSVGYGDDVVVIYRSNGTLVKKFGLEDLLTEGDIETLPHSVSSIWWGGEHYIDEANGLLILRVAANRKSPWEEGAEFHALKIELATGRTLEPKRDLFPQPRVFDSVDSSAAPQPAAVTPGEPRCSSTEGSFDSPRFTRLPSEKFYAKAKERPLPPYPANAKIVRAEGTIVVEVLVSKTGDVICARSLSGHPLLRASAVAAALKWRFEPVEASGNPVDVVGTIAIDFRLTEKNMNPDNQPNH